MKRNAGIDVATGVLCGLMFCAALARCDDFVPIPACRVIDTRENAKTLKAEETRSIRLAGTCGLPESMTAVAVNVTVVPKGSLAYLTIWQGGPIPNISTINALHGQIVNNGVIVGVQAGAVSIYATNATDVLLDVSGYFRKPAQMATAGGTWVNVVGKKMADLSWCLHETASASLVGISVFTDGYPITLNPQAREIPRVTVAGCGYAVRVDDLRLPITAVHAFLWVPAV